MIRSLYFWVLVFVMGGVTLGVVAPEKALFGKGVGDAFVNGIKILVGPLIFTTVSLGISKVQTGRNAARIGLKAFLYFELVSTLALAIGLLVGNLFAPGSGFPLSSVATDVLPVPGSGAGTGSILNPFQGGVNLVQVLVLSVFSGVLMLNVPSQLKRKVEGILGKVQETLFKVLGLYMWLAPLGAGAAMASTVGRFGVTSLAPLLALMLCFYATCFLFVVVVLGFILKRVGIPVFSFLAFIKEEILLVLGTSSSESALGPLMRKLERLGCDPRVVGLVVPTGYSFNLDGTNIYLTLAILFIAQAFRVPLGLGEQIGILLFAMLSSKGASGVTGAGFITLTATMSVVPEVPVAGLGLILGVDRFMSEARAITNMIGNGVGALAIARWEGGLDSTRLREVLVAGGKNR